jgi:hypothetical protein
MPIVNFSYDEKTHETQTAKQLKLQDDSVFATSVPLSDNTACAASTPECAHQKCNITIMKICDSVTTSTVRGRMPHFRDALIEEQILYFSTLH